ncbi:MAG: hypothetical protein AAF098_10425 [Pseudomonadota bacterium]
MTWATQYALQNLGDADRMQATQLNDEVLQIASDDKPTVLAFISPAEEIDLQGAQAITEINPDIDFLCGYRKRCLWHGDAIEFLEQQRVGWGSFGTLTSAVLDGDANLAGHKTFRFVYRVFTQMGGVRVQREYDRVIVVTRGDGKRIRVSFAENYEPTADVVRELWTKCGPSDVICNINPNGRPTAGAHEAAKRLGTIVLNVADTLRHIRQS